MKQFDYKIIFGENGVLDTDVTDPLGNEGWELVSVTVDSKSGEVVGYFKREVKPKDPINKGYYCRNHKGSEIPCRFCIPLGNEEK